MAGVTQGAENRFLCVFLPGFLASPSWMINPPGDRGHLEVKFKLLDRLQRRAGEGGRVFRGRHIIFSGCPAVRSRLPASPPTQPPGGTMFLHTVAFVSPLAGASVTALVKELVSIFFRQS